MLHDSIISPEITDMASTINLNQREFRVILAIGLQEADNPSEIADASGISRSKIYEVLDSLKEREILIQDDSKYKLSKAYLTETRKTFEKKSDLFKKFLIDLEQFSTKPTVTYLELIKNKLNEMFIRLKYHISELKISEVPPAFKRALANSSPLGFIATSPDSGRKIGVIILQPKKSPNKFDDSILLYEIIDRLDVHTSLIVYSHATSKETLMRLRMFEERNRRSIYGKPYLTNRAPMKLLSYSEINDEKLNELSESFTDFDNNWRLAITDLNRLSPEMDNFKRMLAHAMTNTAELKFTIDKLPQFEKLPSFAETLREVVDRVSADIKLYGESIDTVKEIYSNELRYLEYTKRLPEEGRINKIQREVDQLQINISKSMNELESIKEEIGYFQKDDKRYNNYGFRINPFIFTVPFSAPEYIVNQQKARTYFNQFIRDIEDDSENRTLIISDEFGKGKTHLMLYFKKQILEKKNSKILPIYIKCPPRYPEVDLIDLYSQIVIGTNKWKDIDEQLVQKLGGIITKVTPKNSDEFTSILRDITLSIYEKGFTHILLMIDEFENMLPEQTRLQRETKEREPRTLIQLKSLMQIKDIAFVFTIRKQTWINWRDSLSEIVNSKEIREIELQKFDENDTKGLINERMKMQDKTNKTIEFSEDAIKKIVLNSEGIPREIIKNSREALRKAILKDKDYVSKEDVPSPLVTTLTNPESN